MLPRLPPIPPDSYDRRTRTGSKPARSTSTSAWTSARATITPPHSPPAGTKVINRCLPSSEPKLREVFAELQAEHVAVLVLVDQIRVNR